MSIISNHDEIVRRWVELSPKDLNFPPNCFYHMYTQFTEWDSKQRTFKYPL